MDTHICSAEISRRHFIGVASGVIAAGGLIEASAAPFAATLAPVVTSLLGSGTGSLIATVKCATSPNPCLNWTPDSAVVVCDTTNDYTGDGHVVDCSAILAALPNNEYQDFTATATGHMACHRRDVYIPATPAQNQLFLLGHLSGT